MKTTTKTTPDKCAACPAPAAAGLELCGPCMIELEYRIMASEPEPVTLQCHVCRQAISMTEARSLRFAKNPKAGDRMTPGLCWICAHLYLSAHRRDSLPPELQQV